MTAPQIKLIHVERFSVVSSAPFNVVVKRIEAEIGHPDIQAFGAKLAAARTPAELEAAVAEAAGSSGLLEFVRFNLGEVLRKEPAYRDRQAIRLVVGNPVIMKEMAKHVPDAASYAPVTILIDARPGGVQLSYDRMASYLASYENAAALDVARNLDAKIEALLLRAAG